MLEKNKIPVDAVTYLLNAKYQLNGLTYASNIPDVNKRDEAGNLQYDYNDTSKLLVIEPIVENITNASVLKVIDTQFTYYKFPARTTVVEDEPLELDLDLTILEDIDPLYARYSPSEDRRILASNTYAGILMDSVQDGLMQRKPNAYYISKAIKDTGKDLRFRVTIEHRYDSGNTDELSRAYFSLIKSSVSTGVDRAWRTYEAPNDGAIMQYEVQKLFIDEIIPNDQLEIGDTFNIGAYCTVNEEFRYHTITASTTYWSITDADKNVDEWNQEIN